jgi:hypothetical protein
MAAFGSKIDYIIRGLDHIEMMFDDKNRDPNSQRQRRYRARMAFSIS